MLNRPDAGRAGRVQPLTPALGSSVRRNHASSSTSVAGGLSSESDQGQTVHLQEHFQELKEPNDAVKYVRERIIDAYDIEDLSSLLNMPENQEKIAVKLLQANEGLRKFFGLKDISKAVDEAWLFINLGDEKIQPAAKKLNNIKVKDLKGLDEYLYAGLYPKFKKERIDEHKEFKKRLEKKAITAADVHEVFEKFAKK